MDNRVLKIEKLLLDNRREIDQVFAESGDLLVSIRGLDEPLAKSPDIEILVNLDLSEPDEIVAVSLDQSRVYDVNPSHRHDLAMSLILKLTKLLGVSVNVVDEGGLKSYYPLTYANSRR